jgi:hypothetical protein
VSTSKQHIVIIGATSAIAEHCARLWVQNEAVQLTLVGRNAEKTEWVAADLRVRSPESDIRTLTAEFTDPAAVAELVNGICTAQTVDIVLIAHGSLPDQQDCQNDLALIEQALNINAISPVLFAEHFATLMARQGSGNIGIISSVAGDRGRKSNYVYGSAKGLVTRYAQGLQHRFGAGPVQISLIKPGPTATPMTAHLKAQGNKLARVEDVAEIIVKGIGQGKPVIYAPAKWALIMLIIRHLPRWIFNKMDI